MRARPHLRSCADTMIAQFSPWRTNDITILVERSLRRRKTFVARFNLTGDHPEVAMDKAAIAKLPNRTGANIFIFEVNRIKINIVRVHLSTSPIQVLVDINGALINIPEKECSIGG